MYEQWTVFTNVQIPMPYKFQYKIEHYAAMQYLRSAHYKNKLYVYPV